MIRRNELELLAASKLVDANVLFEASRYDAAVYLCGSVIELSLKLKICRTLNWAGFPDSSREFDNLRSFRTHNLEILATLSGEERRIKSDHLSEWNDVSNWDPSMRYFPVGSADKTQAERMITSAEVLMEVI